MSKLDAQRAMREARYAARNSSGPTRRQAAAGGAGTAPATPESEPATKPRRTAKAAPTAAKAAPATAKTPESGELCGHTSMNGRSCTRPAGHSEKSHRYG